jgi:endonuclease YncB( thermonuclease family)
MYLKSNRRFHMPRKEKVTNVIDGDTFETSVRKHPVRLENVDTPEKGEPGYQKAKRELEKLIKDKEVTVNTVARDTFKRPVAKVKAGSRSVNKAMQKYRKK